MDTFPTPMEQAVFEEPLFPLVGKLVGEPTRNLG